MEIKLIIHALKAKQIRLLEKRFVKRKSQPHVSKVGVFDTLVQWSCKTFRSQRNSLFSVFISCFTPTLSTQRRSGISIYANRNQNRLSFCCYGVCSLVGVCCGCSSPPTRITVLCAFLTLSRFFSGVGFTVENLPCHLKSSHKVSPCLQGTS